MIQILALAFSLMMLGGLAVFGVGAWRLVTVSSFGGRTVAVTWIALLVFMVAVGALFVLANPPSL